MTTQTISGAEILMREYIKLGMKVGSRVRVTGKIEVRGIGWRSEMYDLIGSESEVTAIDDYNLSCKLSNSWYYPIESIDLIIEPDEMPFEGTVPDGWELSWGGQMWRIELIYSSEVLKKAWFSYANQDFVADFSQLTLKRKPCSPNNK